MVAITVLAIVYGDSTKDEHWSDCYTHRISYPFLSITPSHISIAYKYNSILLLSVRAKTQFNHKTCTSFVEPALNGIQVVQSKK